MAGSGGRHARPDEPDEVDASVDASGITPPTQPLPVVRREGPETRHVRAVAKRVPSALPALGRDDVSGMPASVRAAIDRRRRAREMAAGNPPMGQPAPTSPPAPMGQPAPTDPPSSGPSPSPAQPPATAPSAGPAPSSSPAPPPPSSPPSPAPPPSTAPSPSPAPPPATTPPAGPPPATTQPAGPPPATASLTVPRQRPEPAIEQTGGSTAPAAPQPAEATVPDSAPADVELVPVGSRTRAIPPMPSPRPDAPPAPAPAPASPASAPPEATQPEAARATTWDAPTGHLTPYAAGGPATPPPAPPADHSPAADAQPDPESRASEAPVPESPVPESPVIENRPPYALPDAQTDEWVSVPAPHPPSAPLVVPSRPRGLSPSDGLDSPSDEWEATGPAESAVGRPAVPSYPPTGPGQPGQPAPIGQPAPAGQPAAAGQTTATALMTAVAPRDTADTTPLPMVSDEYRGRRRARHRAGRLNPRLVAVLGVLVVLSAAVAVPFLVAEPTMAPFDAASVPASASPTSAASPTTPAAPVTPEAGIPVIVAPPPWSVTLQAESVPNNALGGGATKRGDVVDLLGSWPPRRQSGWLEFRGITVPEAGAQYLVRVFYRYETYCVCNTRRLDVWVNGTRVQSWSFTDPGPGYREVTVTLGAGENTIRLTHGSSASPAIDRIEIART